ncbi:hypothetical protein NW762_013230 [Fusarium torreyae]|uniref:Peptidase M61 catalytic domain-containing protein n=1 Tax=Fusarium torreyae TaxID=1237075 RepID=A0A9W8RM77_9HYPO|nr:hypothetical protein NW762_013230 [Fusarium torreyae]
MFTLLKTCLFVLQVTLVARTTCLTFSPNSSLPQINITLTPYLNGENPVLHGKIVLEIDVANNETLVQLPTTLAGQPSARYTNKTLNASDSSGPLVLKVFDDPNGAEGQPTRLWNTERKTQGLITVEFTAEPRYVKEDELMGPLFDIRANGKGLIGSSWALLPLPPISTAEFQYTLNWDLKQSPNGTDAVWTWGEGSQPPVISGSKEDVLYTYWAVGNLSSYPSEGTHPLSPKFGMYWLQEPSFNVTATATFIDKFFNYSSTFWHDDGTQPYRVFIRHNDNAGTGGTALTRSFTFGWHDDTVTQDYLDLLLAHEITHNWPHINDKASAPVTRYAEGTAEYYSLRLVWRNEQITTARYLKEMNDRLQAYYTNPVVNLTDDQAYDQAWELRSAQRIPYGRGLIYLINVDAHIRKRSKGKHNLDSLTLELQDTCIKTPANCTEAFLLKLLTKYVGSNAVKEYHQVAKGGKSVIRPVANSLGPCFDVVKTNSTPPVFQWRAKKGKDIESKACFI